MNAAVTKEYVSKRDPALKIVFTVLMTAAIWGIGALMMTISSSPTVKGASFLWLPAALQLVAGVWLGPWLGFIAGGLGAYLAGGFNYGGWGIVDIIMNPIAGGFANAMLPALLFRALKIDATLGAKKPGDVLTGAFRIVILGLLVLAAAWASSLLNLPAIAGTIFAFGLTAVIFVIGAAVLFHGLELNRAHVVAAVIIAVVSCAVSAFIGAIGATVGGKPFAAALLDPGVGWFAGDTVSAFLGLYLLALYTQRLRAAGIAE